MTNVPVTMTFWEHLAELRARVLKSVLVIVTASILGFIFNEQILDLLLRPLCQARPDDCQLAFLRPTEAFSVVMRLSLFGGVLIASPFLIYQLWRFVSPAFSKRERRYVIPLSGILGALFLAGIALGWWSLQRGLGFLFDFGGDNLRPVITSEAYLGFAMRFVLAFGIAFEFPVFLFAAAATGIVDTAKLRAGRRWAVVLILIGAALLTPSGDPLTLMLLSAPLYLMYELTILAVRFILKK